MENFEEGIKGWRNSPRLVDGSRLTGRHKREEEKWVLRKEPLTDAFGK